MEVRDFSNLCKQYTDVKHAYKESVDITQSEIAAQKMRDIKREIERVAELSQKIVGDDPLLVAWVQGDEVEKHIRILLYHNSWLLRHGY